MSGIRKMTLRQSHDTAWRFIRGMAWKMSMCCVTCNCGPNSESLACALRDGHPGPHSWGSLPTFPINDNACEVFEAWVADHATAEVQESRPAASDNLHETPRWLGSAVARFATAWNYLPGEVKAALVTLRAYEEEGAYQSSVLSDPVRGFFRQSGGASAVEATLVKAGNE